MINPLLTILRTVLALCLVDLSCTSIDCSQPLYLAHVKGNASEANAKHAGWGGLQTKRARTNREAVDIFGKK